MFNGFYHATSPIFLTIRGIVLTTKEANLSYTCQMLGIGNKTPDRKWTSSNRGARLYLESFESKIC